MRDASRLYNYRKSDLDAKKLKASKMMLDMAKQTFLEMGYPVK